MQERNIRELVTSVSHIATQNEKGASLISARVRIDHPDENVFLGVDAKVTIQQIRQKMFLFFRQRL